MPALIGGFGNISYILFVNNFSKSSNCSSLNLYTQKLLEKDNSSIDIKSNSRTTSYLEEAINIRKDFNATRTTYNWNHFKNCYLTNNSCRG